MSTTFLRGLALVELVGVEGPIGVSELARRLGTDKGGVSRMVSAAVDDGWLARTDTGVVLGPRLPVLAHHSDLAGVLRKAQPLVDAVAGVTGLFTHVYLAVGHGVMPVLSAGRPPIGLPRPPGLEMPLWSIAAGRALSTLIDAARLLELVPDGPLVAGPTLDAVHGELAAVVPGGEMSIDGHSRAPTTRAEFMHAVEGVRTTGVAYDHGDVHPLIHCIAVPWPGLTAPAAICVIGSASDIAADGKLAETVLRQAVLPGVTRDRIVARAAEHHQAG